MTPVIEQGIPIPPKKNGKQAHTWPLDQMAVGDSFVVPPREGVSVPNLARRATAAIGNFRRTHPLARFTVRAVDGHVRVWRIRDAKAEGKVA